MDTETKKYRKNYIRLAQFFTGLNFSTSDTDPKHKLRSVIASNIIKRGVDINYQIKDEPCNNKLYAGYTLLHFATLARDLNSVEVLLKHGADFTIKSYNEKTPLHNLIEQSITTRWIKDQEHTLPLINIILSSHIKTGNTSNPTDKNGISHFHIACMVNNIEAVEFFLKAGVPVNESVSMDSLKLPGYTPLHFAARYSCLEVTKVLLNHGVDVTIKDSRGMNPLHLLIEDVIEIMDVKYMSDREFPLTVMRKIEDSVVIINLLIELQDSNFIDDYGISKLHVACTMLDKSTAEELLNKGVDLNDFVNTDSPIWPGYTALHFAAHMNTTIIDLLIEKGANIAAKDVNGVTPFDLCMQRWSPEVIYSILMRQDSVKDIILTDNRTKLLDFILALETLWTLAEFLKNLTDINAAVPNNSLLWPGYTILHLTLLFAERSREFQDFYEDFDFEENVQYFGEEDLERGTDLKKILMCMTFGASVNFKAANGWTPIHLAFHLQREKIVKILLNYYTSQTVENPSDETNLSHFHIACAIGEEEIVKIFLDRGIDANIPVRCSFKWYNKKLESRIERNFITIRENSTPLHIAVVFQKYEIVKLLINRNADPYIQDMYGLTPIHLTLDSNNTYHSRRNAHLMLTSTMNSRFVKDSTTKEGLSYLHVAAFAGNDIYIEELLRQGVNINSPISYPENSPEELSFLSKFSGCTPLHCAVMNFCPRTIELLIDKGADIHAKNADGKSPLQIALDKEREYIKIFVSKIESVKMTNIIDESGLTLLHLACAIFDKLLVKTLLENGADVNAVINKESRSNWSNYTPLHVLITETVECLNAPENLEEIIQLLLDYGADVSKIDADGSSPLHLAYKMSISHNAPYLLDIVHKMFKQTTADINLTNANGLSHFHLACFGNNMEILEKFFKGNVDINQPVDAFGRRHPGYTPLHFAIENGSEQLVSVLLDHGADFTAEDSHGDTLLHLAVQKEPLNLNIVKQVLSMGADINYKNIWGESPFELLLKSKNAIPDFIQFFLNHGCCVNVVNPVTMEGLLAKTMNTHPQHLRPDLKPAFKSILSSSDITKLDENGFNAIHNIVSNHQHNEFTSEDYAEVIEKLLELDCEIDQQDKIDRTPLYVAVEFKNVAAVTGLIQLGADINIIETDGKTLFSRYLQLSRRNLTVSDLHMLTTFVLQMKKMLFLGLNVNQIDMSTLSWFPCDMNVTCRYTDEMKKMVDVKIESTWTLKDFLIEPGLIAEYPAMSRSQQRTIDEYFKQSSKIRREFPELGCILMLQYRKALKRVKLIELAIDIIISIGIELPELCIVIILKYFNEEELNFLIENAPVEPLVHKRFRIE